jgi:hypothetical protein
VSYLRALVRKTLAPRPRIVPRAPPPIAQPSFDLAEMVREEVVTTIHPAATVPSAEGAVAVPIAPAYPTQGTPRDAVPARESKHAPDDRASAQRAGSPAGATTPRPTEVPPAAQRIVSRRIHAIGRRAVAPTPESPGERAEAGAAADLGADPILPVRAPQRIAREPARRRGPHPAGGVPAPDRDLSWPDVHISIGRLEVRANMAAPAKPERPAPVRPALTLQDYLAGRSRGQR